MALDMQEQEKINEEVDIETIKDLAAERGHNEWKIDAEAAGFVAGFPDKKRQMRTGLLPYHLIKAIQTQYKHVGGDIKDLLLSNTIRMILKTASNTSETTDSLVLDPEVFELLKKSKNDLSQLTTNEKEDIKKWIVDIATDWAFRNDKWGEDVEYIITNLDNQKNPLEELYEIRNDILDVKKAPTAEEMLSIFQRDSKVFLYLSEVHGNWRETEIKNANKTDAPIKITKEKAEGNIIDVVEENQAIRDVVIPFSVGLSQHVKMYSTIKNDYIFKQRLIEMIEAYRSIYHKKEEISQEVTFYLMLKFALIIENEIRENPNHPSLSILAQIRDHLLGELKKDTNTGPIDTIIEYFEKNEN